MIQGEDARLKEKTYLMEIIFLSLFPSHSPNFIYATIKKQKLRE